MSEAPKEDIEEWLAEPEVRELRRRSGKERSFLSMYEGICKELQIDPPPKIVVFPHSEPNVYCHSSDGKIDLVGVTIPMLDIPADQAKATVKRLFTYPDERVLPPERFLFSKMVDEWVATRQAWRPRPEVPNEKKLLDAFQLACDRAVEKGIVANPPKEIAIYPDIYKNAGAVRDPTYITVGAITISTAMLALPFDEIVAVLGHEIGHSYDKALKIKTQTIERGGLGVAAAAGAGTGVYAGDVVARDVIPPVTGTLNSVIRALNKASVLGHHLHIATIPTHHLVTPGTVAASVVATAAVSAGMATAGASDKISALSRFIDERRRFPDEHWADKVGTIIAGEEAVASALRMISEPLPDTIEDRTAALNEMHAMLPEGYPPEVSLDPAALRFPQPKPTSGGYMHPPMEKRIKNTKGKSR